MAKRGLSFRDCVGDYEFVMGKIAARDFSPIYLLMGEEAYFIDMISDALAEGILGEAERSFNQIVLYGRDCEAGQVINHARQVPMMGGLSVVIVKEAQQMRNFDKLQHYTAAPSPTTILVLCYKEKVVDKRLQVYKSIAKHGVIFESVRPRDYEIGPWLTAYIKGRGITPTPKAVMMISESLGTDLSKIEGEISKLLLALPENANKFDEEDVERYIGISKEFNNFELSAAIVARDAKRALRIAEHFGANPKNYPLLLSLSVLFGNFKTLFALSYMRWQKQMKGVPFPPDSELMSRLRVPNPFALKELKQQMGLWNSRSLFVILGLLREYDAKCKGMNRGAASDGELLRELIIKIFEA